MANTPQKRRNFTMSLVVEKTPNITDVISIVEKYPAYAYILHDKDNTSPHYHFYIEFPNPRSFSSVADELKIPESMLCKVYDKSAILQYLTHENDKDKYHYPFSDVVTNLPEEAFVKYNINSLEGTRRFMDDYILVKQGKLSWEEFYKSHIHAFTTLSPYNKMRVIDLLFENAYGTEGLSPFRVPGSTNRGGV